MKLFGFWTELPYTLNQIISKDEHSSENNNSKYYSLYILSKSCQIKKNELENEIFLLNNNNLERERLNLKLDEINDQQNAICYESIKSSVALMNKILSEASKSNEIKLFLQVSRLIISKINEETNLREAREEQAHKKVDFLNMYKAFIEKVQVEFYKKSSHMISAEIKFLGEKRQNPLETTKESNKRKVTLNSFSSKSISTVDSEEYIIKRSIRNKKSLSITKFTESVELVL